MLKYLTGWLTPSKGSFSPIKPFRATHINKIRLYHGPIFDLAGSVESIAFFMPEDLRWQGPLNRSVLMAAGDKLDGHIADHVITPHSGEVYALPPFDAPFKGLMMAVIDEWDGGVDFEDRDLVRCYRDAVRQVAAKGMTSIAFPAMGRDKRDFPHIRFARLAVEGIADGLAAAPAIEQVAIACTDRLMMDTYGARLKRMGWKSA